MIALFIMWLDDLTRDDTYAFLVIVTDNEAFVRPIIVGDGGICEAVREASEKYPGCRLRLFTRDHDRRYFEPYVPPKRIF
ncbi:hypothetical protein SDD30_14125 [Moorella naiadis]|uniref:hypothetical protein n=1 Tax=Moorella naiadis (nom. illeg.) TaxID=3093670 RepID=UPI003D9C9DA2